MSCVDGSGASVLRPRTAGERWWCRVTARGKRAPKSTYAWPPMISGPTPRLCLRGILIGPRSSESTAVSVGPFHVRTGRGGLYSAAILVWSHAGLGAVAAPPRHATAPSGVFWRSGLCKGGSKPRRIGFAKGASNEKLAIVSREEHLQVQRVGGTVLRRSSDAGEPYLVVGRSRQRVPSNEVWHRGQQPHTHRVSPLRHTSTPAAHQPSGSATCGVAHMRDGVPLDWFLVGVMRAILLLLLLRPVSHFSMSTRCPSHRPRTPMPPWSCLGVSDAWRVSPEEQSQVLFRVEVGDPSLRDAAKTHWALPRPMGGCPRRGVGTELAQASHIS